MHFLLDNSEYIFNLKIDYEMYNLKYIYKSETWTLLCFHYVMRMYQTMAVQNEIALRTWYLLF